MTGSHSRETQRVSSSLMEFTFKYMKKGNLATNLVLGKELQPQQEGRWGVRRESFESFLEFGSVFLSSLLARMDALSLLNLAPLTVDRRGEGRLHA